MKLLRLIPDETKFDFMRWRVLAFALTILLSLGSVLSLATQGLVFGNDFAGGILVEARASKPLDLGQLRGTLDTLGLGGITLQQIGVGNDVLIRAPEQPGDEKAQAAAVERIKGALGSDFEIRRTEFIGPQVSAELLRGGIIAALLAVLCIAVYVGFRFEWQFGLSALITTFHDVLTTAGLFSLLRLDFDMTIVAAILTIAGYVGSSRVDLQACKLEYSIVSPK